MLHIVSTGLVLPRLELWLGSQWESEKLMTSALWGLFVFLVATAEALAFCDENFRCMMGDVIWGWTVWNQNSVLVPRILVKHLPPFFLATDKIRHPGYSVLDCPEWWNLTKMVEGLRVTSDQWKPGRVCILSPLSSHSFIHLFIQLISANTVMDAAGVCLHPSSFTTWVHFNQLHLLVPLPLLPVGFLQSHSAFACRQMER